MRRRVRWSMFGDRRDQLPQHIRLEILTRDRSTCSYCAWPVTADAFHVDHVVPVHLGGGNTPDNLVTACPDCNMTKGAELSEFWMRLLYVNGSRQAGAIAERVLVGWFQTDMSVWATGHGVCDWCENPATMTRAREWVTHCECDTCTLRKPMPKACDQHHPELANLPPVDHTERTRHV